MSYSVFVFLCVMPFKSAHVAADGKISFFFFNDWVVVHCIYTTAALSIRLLMNTCVTFISWQLWTMWLWTLRCMYLFKNLTKGFLSTRSFLQSIFAVCQGIVNPYLILLVLPKSPSYRIYQFAFPTAVCRSVPISPSTSPTELIKLWNVCQ